MRIRIARTPIRTTFQALEMGAMFTMIDFSEEFIYMKTSNTEAKQWLCLVHNVPKVKMNPNDEVIPIKITSIKVEYEERL